MSEQGFEFENPYHSPQHQEPQPPHGVLSLIVDQECRLHTIWRFCVFGVGFIFIELVGGIAALICLLVYYAAIGEQFPLERLTSQDASFHVVLMIAASPWLALFGFGLAVLCRLLLDRRSIASMGFVWPARRLSSSILIGFLLGLAPILIGAAAIFALGGYDLQDSAMTGLTLLLIPCLVLAAFHEEVIFRSYLLQNLLDARKPVFGVLFTSVVFWLVHSLNPHAWSTPLVGVNLFGAGVVLALAYMVSQNIWFPTVMHFAWNFAQGVLLSVPVSGIPIQGALKLELNGTLPDWLTGGQFGFEGSPICTVTIIAITFLLIGMLKLRKEREPFHVPLDDGDDDSDQSLAAEVL